MQTFHTSCYPVLDQPYKSELIFTSSSSLHLYKLNIIGLQILDMRRMNQSCCKGITRSPEDDGSDFELVSLSVAVIGQSYACESFLCMGRSILYLVVASRKQLYWQRWIQLRMLKVSMHFEILRTKISIDLIWFDVIYVGYLVYWLLLTSRGVLPTPEAGNPEQVLNSGNLALDACSSDFFPANRIRQ